MSHNYLFAANYSGNRLFHRRSFDALYVYMMFEILFKFQRFDHEGPKQATS